MCVVFIASSCDSISPTNSNTPISTIKSNLKYSFEKEDTIPSIFLELIPKMSSNDYEESNYITFKVENSNDFDITLKAYGEITDYTNLAKKTITVESGKSASFGLFPMLSPGVFSSLSELKAIPYNIKLDFIYENETINLIEETPTAILTAKDVIYWSMYDDESDEWINLCFLIAGWVTPHVSEVDELIRVAAAYHSSGQLIGYQGTPDPDKGLIAAGQVEAIFNALKTQYLITYINSSISYPTGTQRVKYPADALNLASANCIDGTILIAAALENIGLKPVVILVPGHAFIGWYTWEDSETIDALETTMIGNSDFYSAHSQGITELHNEFNNGNFDSGISQMIDIQQMRNFGLTPLMKRRVTQVTAIEK